MSGSLGFTTRPPVWFTGGLINRNYVLEKATTQKPKA
jgi:hypothetical protein